MSLFCNLILPDEISQGTRNRKFSFGNISAKMLQGKNILLPVANYPHAATDIFVCNVN